MLGCLDRRELVGRLLERKGGLELGHPVAVLGGIGKPRLAGRWAWMSSSSWARSTTASATRFFRFSQVDEPIFESTGAALPPPTYFCTRSILAIGTYSFVPSANSSSRVSSACSADLIDELQAAIAGDAVVDVDDQVALVQVEEAVDGPALVPSPGDRAADVGPGEELVVGDDQGARRRSGESPPGSAPRRDGAGLAGPGSCR